MDKRLIAALIICVAALLALPVLAAPPDYDALRQQLREDLIQPGYATFALKARALDDQITGHCENTGEAPGMLAARSAFHDAMDAWQAVQHIRHGTVAINDRHARLQFWPDKRGITERHLRRLLAAPVSATLNDDISGASVAVQGFSALERLMFSKVPLSRHNAPGEKSDRCRVAKAITANISAIASALEAESKTTAKGDAKTGIADSLNDVVTGLEFIQSLKLILPARTKKPQPHLLENWRSKRSLRNVRINIRSLREHYKLLYGDAPPDDPVHKRILDQFTAAEDITRAMGEDGKLLLGGKQGVAKFLALADALERVLKMIATTLPGGLQVNLGFNSLDGD